MIELPGSLCKGLELYAGCGVVDEETACSHTFPTAASPRRTSFTLLLGFGADAPESAIADFEYVE